MSFFLLIWAVCTLGFIGLASAMQKHQKQIFGQTLSTKHNKIASMVGWGFLSLGLILCMSKGQVSNMMSYWVGVLTFAALFVALCLTYFESKMKKIILGVSFIGFISMIFSII